MGAEWLKFTTKMKWVLFGTAASLIGTVGLTAADTFKDQSWAAFIPVAVPFILGYIPKEKNPTP